MELHTYSSVIFVVQEYYNAHRIPVPLLFHLSINSQMVAVVSVEDANFGWGDGSATFKVNVKMPTASTK
jgi:hypothetical protein